MTENCFDVLGIAPTKDETIIKKAYRKLLHKTNPEDDMQGFTRLRGAYEEACRYARKKETPKKRASEQFMERCRTLYDSFFRRIRPEEWEVLFAEPVCVNLDTEEEVRRVFLTFLMDHFHFPPEVWKCIDSAFAISTDRRTLAEWFPEDFVDYLQQAVKDEGVLNYTLFESRESEDGGEDIFGGQETKEAKESREIDEYIERYYRLRQFTDLGMMEQAGEELRLLKESPVYHPYGEIEEARMFLCQGKKEEAGKIFLRLGKAYPTEERIACCYGQFLQMENRWEELWGVYDRLLAQHPDSVGAKTGKAEELIHDGEYRKGREMVLDLLEYSPQDERLIKDLSDANLSMIEELETSRKEGSLTQDGQMDLGWCYYQNLQFEDALRVLDNFVPDEEHLLDYHNLKGRVYLTMDRNEEALTHLLPWLSGILQLRPDGTKKTQRRLARLGYACYTVGSAKAAILLQKKDAGENIRQEDFAEAMRYLEKAVKTEQEEGQVVSYYHTIADIWRQCQEYGKVVDVCDKMLRLNPGYYPAVLLRQEACLFLGMYQEVADDYQRAVHMYPFYGRPYATLIKMYFLFGEYEKIREIFKITEEYEIESDALKMLRARYRAVTAVTREDLKDALSILDALQEKGRSSDSDMEREEWDELTYRRGLILTDLGRLTEAREALEASLKEDRGNVSKLFAYASVLMQSEEYDLAVHYLKQAHRLAPDDDGILYRIGWCYKLKGEYKESLSCMKQVLELNPKHSRVRQIIVELYERLARREEDNAYYHLAVPYMKEQVERYPEEYYLVEMGLLYLDMDEYEKALFYFKKAGEKNPESVYVYNNAGNCRLSMNQPREAEKLFLKAVRLMKNEKTPLPYNNLAKCYRILGKYEEALQCYKKNMELFPDNPDMYLLLGDFYRENEEYHKAIATYEEGMSRTGHQEPLEMEMLRTYGMKGDYAMVSALCRRLRKKYPDNAVLYQLAGEVCLFGFERCGEAASYLQEALRLGEQSGDRECVRGSLYLLGRCRLFEGRREEAEKYFLRYMKSCRGEDGCQRRYEEFYGERGRRKFRIGCVCLFLGEVTEAEHCFREMRTEKCRCDGCTRTCCYEKLLGEAMLLFAKGETARAVEAYRRAAKKVPDDMEHRFELRRLQECLPGGR